MGIPLKDLVKEPFVQELMQQNEMLADAVPEDFSGSSRQHLALGKKKINLDDIHVPYIIKNRLLFQEGTHNNLFYSFEEMSKDENLSQWDNLDIFMAEHADASNHWVGLSKNPYLVKEEKAIYGDIEIIDKPVAQKLAYQILTKNGKMGLSPTLDVDKKMVNGRATAGGPWQLKSQSIVLNPAVRTTVFNSAQGGAQMGNEEGDGVQTQQLKKDEVAISKEELESLKAAKKDLAERQKQDLAREVEQLSALEVELGLYTEEELSSRKEILGKLSESERKVLSGTYGRLSQLLSDEDPEERFINQLPEELKGQIPPGLRKFIEERRKKKGKEEMAKKKKPGEEEDEEEMAHKGMMPEDKKKKYPYPEKGMMGQKLEEQNLSRQSENLVLRRPDSINKFQELSQESRESNQEFIDFLLVNQGDKALAGRSR